jgi:hypothetical protein
VIEHVFSQSKPQETPHEAHVRLLPHHDEACRSVPIQYRTAQYFYMIGMIAEPVIYLVVWSTVAQAQGGSVGGYHG